MGRLKNRLARVEGILWKAYMDGLSDAEIETMARGGPGELNLGNLTADELGRLAAGDPLAVVVPHWRKLLNPRTEGGTEEMIEATKMARE